MDVVQYAKDEVVRYDPSVGPSDLVLSRPHYGRVDKGAGTPDCEVHREWRRNFYIACRESKAARRQAIVWCKEDMLFFFNAFLWLYEPRDTDARTIVRPFLTWPHQDEAIAHIERYLGRRTLGIEKSRGEGASWLVLMCFLHQWLFFPIRTFGLVSKDEKTANDHSNPDSLTFKLLWQLERLQEAAPWLLPKGWDESRCFLRSKGSLINPLNKSTVNSYSATGSVATGGRKTAILMDELSKFPRGDDADAMASTQPVTDCRILVSTPYGDSGAYYDAMHQKGSSMLKIVLHWPMNPIRSRGLYEWPENEEKPRLLDDGYEYQDGYEFVQDGKLRSPWYDKQSSEPDMLADPRKLAQEYDLNYGGSTVKFYSPELRESLEPLVRRAGREGEVDYDAFGSVGVWEEILGGKTWIWLAIGRGRPAAGRYVVGVDIAAGTGGSSSSNSAIVALDVDSGEQVLEWKDSMTRPAECAQQAVAICKWLGVGGEHPLLVWENNGGYGEMFTHEVTQVLDYPNLYKRWTLSNRRRKRTRQLGYRTVDRTVVHEQIRKFLSSGRITIRSEELLAELSQFEYNGDKVQHNGSALREDGATGKAHGDIVTALGMAAIGLEELGGGASAEPASSEKARRTPKHSFGARIQAFVDREKRAGQDLVNW